MSEAPLPGRSGRRGRTAALIFLVAAAFLAYAGMLIGHASFTAGGSDSSGYANAARLIAKGRVVAPAEGLDQLDLPDDYLQVFIPLGFVPGPRPRTMAPFYPPGFPLEMAVAAMVAGWNYGPFLVSPFLALISLLLVYLVARQLGLSRLLATAAAIILALFPTFVFYAEQPMSDLPAAMWTLAAVYFALRSRHGRDGWAAASGAAFAMAVLVRPADLLLILPLGFAFRPRRRTLLLFAAGGIPLAAGLLAWNSSAYGGPLRSPYELSETMKIAIFPGRFLHFARTLAGLFSPLVLAGWALLPADRRVSARDRFLLLTWFLVFPVFYGFWDVDGAWWYTRYLLPGVPAAILGTLLVFRDGLAFGKPGRRAVLRHTVAAAALLLILAVEIRGIVRFDVLKVGEGERIYSDAARWAGTKVPPGSFVVSVGMSGALRYYTALLPVRHDRLGADSGKVLRERTRSRGRGLYALVFPDEVGMLTERLPGGWTRLGEHGEVSLWRGD